MNIVTLFGEQQSDTYSVDHQWTHSVIMIYKALGHDVN